MLTCCSLGVATACLTAGLAVCTGIGAAQAAVYQWVDDKGVVNFTDNPDTIPSRYRAKARVKDMTRDDAVSIIPSGPPAAPPGERLYGGHPAEWWTSKVTAIREQVKTLEEQLVVKRQRLTELHRKRVLFQKGSQRVEYNDLKADIENDEAQLREMQGKLNTLESEAAAAGAPTR